MTPPPRTWRHILAIMMPFVVFVIVPLWILRSRSDVDTRWGDTIPAVIGHLCGVIVFLSGLVLFAWCVRLFNRQGKGTLAPWDPTQRLVDAGPYQYTRNPMITGVALMLAGEALFFGSVALGLWTLLFIIVNQVYFLISEEPGLERRFGAAYGEYKRSVPRWLPRLRRPRSG